VGQRQAHRKGGPLLGAAVYFDLAPVLLGDHIDLGEAHARARHFGGKERMVDTGEVLGVNTPAAVRNLDDGLAAFRERLEA